MTRTNDRCRVFSLSAVAPLFVIGGLLYAGVFVKPRPAGQSVPIPAIEARDGFFGIAAPAPKVLWAAGSLGKVVRSDDGGRTWQRQNTPVRETLQDIAAWDSENAVAVGNQGVVIRTGDGGRTWQQVEAPRSAVSNMLLRVAAGVNGSAIAVGEMGAVLASADYGRSWQRLGDERDITLNDVARQEAHLWVAGEYGKLLHSPDEGRSWNEIRTPATASLTGIAFRDARHGVAVGLEGVLIVTRDGGASWVRMPSPTHLHLYHVTWDGIRWIAVGERDVMLTADADAREWVPDRVSGRDFSWHTKVVVHERTTIFAGPGRALAAMGSE